MSVANQCVTLQHLYYNASWKNELTLASCSLVKHGLILISLGKHHQHTFNNYMHIQLSLSLHFCLLYLLLNNCNGNDAKQCSFLGRLLVAVKRAGASFILADVQSDVLSPSCIHMFFHCPTTSLRTFCDMLPHVSMRCCFKSPVSHHFRCSCLKANKASKRDEESWACV